MRELSVVGPAPTPSSVCTHCLSGSCDQHRGHKEVGTLLNSPGLGVLTVTGNSGGGVTSNYRGCLGSFGEATNI